MKLALKAKTSLWRIKESQNFPIFCGQIWGNSVCSNILNGCEWWKMGEISVTVTKINNRLRCQQSTRAEAALK